MKVTSKTKISSIIRHLSNYITLNDELFENFYDTTKMIYDNIINNFESQEFDTDIIAITEGTRDLSYNLLITALYAHVENVIKLIINSFFINKNKQYKFDQLKKCLKSKDIDICKIKNFNSYNELRLICNSIKHTNNRVSEDLSSDFPDKWKKGNKLEKMNIEFDHLYPETKLFLLDLINKCSESKFNKYCEPLLNKS